MRRVSLITLKPHPLSVPCHSKKSTAGESKSIQGELLQNMCWQDLDKYRHSFIYAYAFKIHKCGAESGVGKTSHSPEDSSALN